MSNFKPRRTTAACATAVLTAVLLLTACSGQTQSIAGDEDAVTIGYVPFDEVVATSFLWKEILETQGFEVEMEQLEVATLYQGVASGQIDFFTGAVPLNHKDYWDRLSEEFVDVGTWYDTLRQGLAVPNYTGLEKISDLEGKAEQFNGQIIGIEAGSGLMDQTKNDAPKVYDLSGYQVLESGTPAMLAALDRAISREEPIVVTLWTPHWAFSRYDITLLEDDKKAYPANDTFQVITSKEFSENKEIVDQLKAFQMEPEELQGLELMISDAGEGNEQEAVQQWISENQDVVDSWTAGAEG